MTKQLHIIYVPGLGDPRYKQQGWILGLWHFYGVQVHYLPLIWGDGDAFEPKFQRLLSRIDELSGQGHDVALIGTSAGASAVLNAYAARPKAISGAVCICGKINNIETVSAYTKTHNPAFWQSLNMLPKSLAGLKAAQRRHIMSVHPIYDNVVPVADTIIEGANEKRILSIRHVPSIAYSLTLGSAMIVRFLKRQAAL